MRTGRSGYTGEENSKGLVLFRERILPEMAEVGELKQSQYQSGVRRASRLALVVFIPWLVFLAFALNDWYREFQLGKDAATVAGIITKVESDNHQRYDYEYTVAGNTYTGGEIIPGASLGTGQGVRVFYIRSAPQTSNLTGFGVVGTRPVPVLFMFVIVSISYFKLRSFLTPSPDPYDR